MGRLSEMFREVVQGVREIERRFQPWSGEVTQDYADGFSAGVAAMLDRLKPLRHEVEKCERLKAVRLASRDEIVGALAHNLEQYRTIEKILNTEGEASHCERSIVNILEMSLRGKKMEEITG